MAAEEGPTALELAFEKLQTCIKNEQHRKALKAADEVLAIAPNDADGLHCKLIAYMQLGEFEPALALISEPVLAERGLAFERAYCLYRLGRIEEALTASHSQSVGDTAAAGLPAMAQLQAQLHYRLGSARGCISIYDKLFQSTKIDSLEVKTNMLAAYVAAGLAGELPQLTSSLKINAKSSFEIGFNMACGRVEQGLVDKAEADLRQALKQGREALFDEELGEEEVEEELAPLSAQLAYVLGRSGRAGDAGEVYDKLIRGDTPLCDDATAAVCTNNSIADAPQRIEAGPQHRKFVASSCKKLESLLEEGDRGGAISASRLPRFLPSLHTRLSAAQRRALLLNLGLLYYVAGRPEPARDLATGLCASAAADAAESDPRAVMLLAAALLTLGKSLDADKHLESFATAQPAAALLPVLMRAQIALDVGRQEAGLQLLSSLTDPQVALSGAILVTRVSLHEALGDASGAEALLEQALRQWRKKGGAAGAPEAAQQALGYCLNTLVGLKLKLGKVSEATSLFQQLLKDAPAVACGASGAGVLVRLARALANTDPSAAPQLVASAGVSGSDAGMAGVDIDSLEDLSRLAAAARKPPVPNSAMELDEDAEGKGKGKKRTALGEDGQPKKKTKRKRKPRYPKGYDPALPGGGLPPPDPERWLPKWERSEAKKKRAGKKARDQVKGSQGAGKVDENLDRTKTAAPAAAAKGPALPSRKGKGRK